MAKGDSVTVWVRGVSQPLVIEATKAGRKLEVRRGPKYVVIDEMTRTNRKTGQLLQIAVTDLAAVVEHKTELLAKPKAKRVAAGQIGLMESIEAGAPAVSAEAPVPPEPKRAKRHNPAAEPDAKPGRAIDAVDLTGAYVGPDNVVRIDRVAVSGGPVGIDYAIAAASEAAAEDDEDAMRQAAEDIFADLVDVP
jgi:hypothetical protein